ncbi:AAA family ATPase [Nonomuraea sp. NPDC049709]|uniref:AAA family ATPase n=1 Tax=Nonomuraea sp. NPDC049709 TaxID=3154736 RepID=UPI00341BCFBA
MPRICPGCRQRVVGKCPICDQPGPRRLRQRAGYGRDERRRRADVVRVHVEQHGWVCPGWQRAPHASEDLTADHVQPTARGGDPAGPLRVLCRPCNSARRAELDTPQLVGVSVTLVAGPPCSGKSSYVREHALASDLVVDYDRLAAALRVDGEMYAHLDSHRPFVAEARDAVLDRVILGNHGVRRVWVMATAAKRAVRESYRRRYAADVVVVWAPEEVCLRRAMGERPQAWWGHVRGWFAAYEPDERDTVIRETAGRS